MLRYYYDNVMLVESLLEDIIVVKDQYFFHE